MASRMLIRPLDFDGLKGTEWDFEKAWRLGNKIPGYRGSASEFYTYASARVARRYHD